MKITAIKAQVKRQGRYSIFVEGKYSFSLSDTALLDSKITTGQEVDEAQIREYKQLSSDDKLYAKALQYAAIRPRSTWEMQSYLKRKEADPLLAEQILSKLSDFNYLNDESFARSWVQSRRLLKPISRRRLVQELRAKRISDEIANIVLAEDETDERDTLRTLIERKRRQTRYQDKTKLMQYLAGQGFGYDDIKQTLIDMEQDNSYD
jgi:regulatory protein